MKGKRLLWALFAACVFLMCIFFAFSEENCVKTKEEAEAYLSAGVMAGKTEIRMKADPSLEEMLTDAKSVYDIFSGARIATAEWSFENGELVLNGIVAYPESVYCESMTDAVNAFRQRKDTVVMNLSKAFYDEFTQNDFARFYELDQIVGITDRSCVYYAETRIFIYEKLKYEGNVVYIDSVEAMKKHIAECAGNMDLSISYTLSDDMFHMVQLNSHIEQEMYAANGIYSYTFYMTNEYRLRQVVDIVYYPGAKIMHAVRNNALDTLDEEEMRLYETALEISKAAIGNAAGKTNMELLIEKTLIQELAARCSYESREEDIYTTATGALLYGIADCDGYSDAFYLLGNLSGLIVHHQLGFMANGGSHMWNLVYAAGSWHFTDPTGCDMNAAGCERALYTDWMGMGRETALSRYIWQSVSQPAQIDADDQDVLEIVLMGNVFDSVSDARKYLETNTDVWTQFAIQGIKEDEKEQVAMEAIYGYGGPYLQYMHEDDLIVVLCSSWFDYENFYDCYTQEEVVQALMKDHDEIILRLSEEMFNTFLADNAQALSEMERKAGILSKERKYYDSTRVFIYKDIVRE